MPAGDQVAREQVHLRRTNEARDENVRGRPVDRHRLVELLQDAVVHHRDAVRHHHRLLLIVGDEDDGGLELALEALDFGARLDPQAGVKVGERFVHEERRRMAHDGPAYRDALPLPAGQFGGRAVEIGVEAKQVGGPGDLGRDRLFLGLLLAQGKGQVFANRHMGIERVVLKHERDIAVSRGDRGHVAAVEQDPAAGNFLEPCDAEEERAFPAARRAEERHEAAVRNLEIERVQDGRRPITLADLLDGDRAHRLNPSPRPTARPERGNAGRRRRPARGEGWKARSRRTWGHIHRTAPG